MRPLVLLLVLVAATILAPAAAGADALERVRAAGVLRFGGDAEGGAPFCFQDPDDPDRILGFEIEIADAVARRLGVRARFVQCQWSSLVETLERGEIDLALNGLEATPALAARVRLTRPYYVFTETLAVRAGDARVRSLEDLVGLRVGTLAATLAHRILRARPGIDIVSYESDVAPYEELAAGRLDAVLLDDVIAARHLDDPTLALADPDVVRGTYVGALRPADESLAAAIDAAIDAMLADGELRAILTRWNLWNERQADLEAGPDPRLARLLGDDAARRPRFTASHFVLFLRGAGMTIVLAVGAFALAVVLGAALCLAKTYGRGPLRALAVAYIELFRGTPVLLQLYLVYFGLADVVRLPALGAAILGLGLNYAAYEAEVYRASLLAVPRGQFEAAAALGFTRRQTMRLVVLPQALRVAIPPMANDFIALLKDTSIVSVITVVELTKQALITAHDLQSWLVPGLLCAGLYFALSYPLMLWARGLERRFSPA